MLEWGWDRAVRGNGRRKKKGRGRSGNISCSQQQGFLWPAPCWAMLESSLKELEEDAGQAVQRRYCSLSSRCLCRELQPVLSPSIFSQWQIQVAPGILVLPPGSPTPAQAPWGQAGLLELPTAHCDILFGSFLSPLAWSEPCLPPQLLAFSVHTITGCDPFEERKWGGRQC